MLTPRKGCLAVGFMVPGQMWRKHFCWVPVFIQPCLLQELHSVHPGFLCLCMIMSTFKLSSSYTFFLTHGYHTASKSPGTLLWLILNLIIIIITILHVHNIILSYSRPLPSISRYSTLAHSTVALPLLPCSTLSICPFSIHLHMG